MSFYISLLGAPGSGKGTQSEYIIKAFPSLFRFSTGDIIRQEIRNESELGLRVKHFLSEGKLVPDDVIIELFENSISEDILNTGILSDGFPRTVGQAESFLRVFSNKRFPIVVLSFDIELDELMDRLLGRRVCTSCSAVYHLRNKPPKQEGICDVCGASSLVQREDDNETSIKTRFDVYQNEITPIKEVFSPYLVSIKANQDPLQVFQLVKEQLLTFS